jgi:hypothetical protein
MRLRLMSVVVVSAAIGTASSATADVRLSIRNGQVTLSASNATAPQILAEWARVGHTRIVNGERVTGGPLTLELSDVPEAQALAVILRAASGFVLAPRDSRDAADNESHFDRIYIVPTSRAPLPSPEPAVTPAERPRFQPPRFAPRPPRQPDEDEAPEQPENRRPAFVNPGIPEAPAVQPPAFNPFPQPIGAPPGGTGGAGAGAAPVGVPVPGMVLPAPAQPGAAEDRPDNPRR